VIEVHDKGVFNEVGCIECEGSSIEEGVKHHMSCTISGTGTSVGLGSLTVIE
jgi:hypothetical protein